METFPLSRCRIIKGDRHRRLTTKRAAVSDLEVNGDVTMQRLSGYLVSSVLRIMTLCLLLAAGSVFSEPEWWRDTPKALLEAAVQNNKSIVLYFESKGSAECEQMELETWPSVDAGDAAKFLWKRCQIDDPKDEVFFTKYGITSVPEIVVLDAEKRERGRLRGFIAPDLILGILNGLPSFDDADRTTIYTYGDGRTFTSEEALAPGFDASQHLFYIKEDFDAANSLADVDRSIFDPYVNPTQTMRIDPTQGYYQSKGLVVAGLDGAKFSPQSNPSVAMRLDLSENFSKVDIVLGYVEVRLRIRVIQLPEEGSTEVLALSVLPAAAKAPQIPDVKDKYREDTTFYNRSNSHVTWKDVVIRTRKPVNFKQQAAWLSLWVDGVNSAYAVDDIAVRILTEEQIRVKVELSSAADPNKILGRVEESESSPLFRKIDADGDGRISRKEFPQRRIDLIRMTEKKEFPQWFVEHDLNKSGFLEPNEFR